MNKGFRLEIARDTLESGRLRELSTFIARERLTNDGRQMWGSIHPWLMGGEYLPPLRETEVEIARISLASTTCDQISVRARRESRRISYDIAWEYDDPLFVLPFRHSEEPLTLRMLISLLEGSYLPGDIYEGGVIEANWEAGFDANGDPDEGLDFVSIESAFYPGLADYYNAMGESWKSSKLEDFPPLWGTGC